MFLPPLDGAKDTEVTLFTSHFSIPFVTAPLFLLNSGATLILRAISNESLACSDI